MKMREEIFELMYKRFMEVPVTAIDEKIREVVFFFQFSSVKDFVVPRWSCQSHDNTDYKTYDIIFFHKNEEGKKIIEQMFRDIHAEYISQYGINYTASVSLQHAYLVTEPNWDNPMEHLQIAFGCDGFDVTIERSRKIWMKVLEEKYK